MADKPKRRGRPPGRKNDKTLEKEAARAALRQMVLEKLRPLVESQVANATGIRYLVAREKRGGRFRRLEREPLPGEIVGSDDEIIEVWHKDPCIAAFTDLMNRAIDKPTEIQQVEVSGSVDMVQRLQAARKRVSGGKSE